VKRHLGEQGIDALTRIMGFLLVCIGVQFIGIAVIEWSPIRASSARSWTHCRSDARRVARDSAPSCCCSA